ncbi:amino acid permease [Clostridium sp. P21]|uniref:Amino acid permease n=1 Tax=Clostridium muellerianum TaxID=2716538 RepID=A0A7Y0HNS6_9CLOT|nr:amino acid permease [Clostridium muellerianum]NMM62326.1 amino acid permease [Clostridium muellerianum]
MYSFFKKKTVDSILDSNKSTSLEKTLGAFDVTLMSIGAVIGTGVMVLTGLVASRDAGPAVVLSFICSAIVCMLVALCYAEFASSIPTSGSAYAYVYVSLGEIIAHLVGWSLIAGYTMSLSAVAGGWAAYFNGLINELGIHIPGKFTTIPSQGGIINLPSIIIVLLITLLLSRGTKESKKINNLLVLVKIGVIILFLAVGVFYIHIENYHPFMPFGAKGVFAGAASVFFAFTGFDAVSTSAEEVKNPQKDLPIGIVCSLIACTIIYVMVCLVLTGIVHYSKLNIGDAMAFALKYVGQGWAAFILSVGAVIGIMAVMLAYIFAASRILFSMSRDGLLPKVFGKVDSKTNVPMFSTLIIGCIGALISGFVDLKQLADVSNMAIITTFMLVSLSVITLRKTHPNLKRNFKTPFVPALPIAAVIFSLFLMANLSKATWIYFISWLILGLFVYFAYSRKNSSLQNISKPNNEPSKKVS